MSVSASLGARERDFSWRDRERLIRFGDGVLAEAPSLLAENGFGGYALLTTARALHSLPQAAEVAGRATVVLEVPPGDVPAAAAAVREAAGRRPLVALGGGRVVDSAKAIAAADNVRCAAIPTTLSGAEITAIHRLPAGVDSPPDGLVRPGLAVCDPAAMASQERAALTASAMNALAHGAEALYGPGANPVSELAALRGAEVIARGLVGDEPDRGALALGAVLCAWAIDRAGLGLHHALSQSTVRVLETPHAETNAVMLPHVLEFVAPHVPDALGALAHALGERGAAPELAGVRARDLAAGAGATRLSHLGVQRSQLEDVVEAVLARRELATTPGRPGRKEIEQLLEAAL